MVYRFPVQWLSVPKYRHCGRMDGMKIETFPASYAVHFRQRWSYCFLLSVCVRSNASIFFSGYLAICWNSSMATIQGLSAAIRHWNISSSVYSGRSISPSSRLKVGRLVSGSNPNLPLIDLTVWINRLPFSYCGAIVFHKFLCQADKWILLSLMYGVCQWRKYNILLLFQVSHNRNGLVPFTHSSGWDNDKVIAIG